MKILQVCSADSFGGGERHVTDLARALIERGHEVHLAVRPNSPLRDALVGTPAIWHEIGLRNSLDLISVWQLATTIKQHRIEVVHAHVARDYVVCGLATRFARNTQAARLFLTRHHFYPIKANRLYAWAIGSVSRFIAVSGSVQACVQTAFPQLRDRVVAIPNWVDLRCVGRLDQQTARESLGIKSHRVIGLIGQITPLKKQDVLIEAAAKMIRNGVVHDVEFVLAGVTGKSPVDQAFEVRLHELVEKLRVQDQVRFVGYIREMATRLQAFDVVVVPSENEAFPLTLVEAMAAGCGVVATRAGGMAEIVQDECNGLLIEPDDATGLEAAMTRLLMDQTLRSKFREAAIARVRENFERETVIGRIEQLYQAQN